MARRNSRNDSNTSTNTDTLTEAPAEVENTPNEYTTEEENTVATVTEPESEVTETPVEASPEESVEENPATISEPSPSESAEEAPAPEKPAEPAIDLTEFQAAVDAAQENKDTTTGLPAEVFIAPVMEAIRKLDGAKGKNKAKAVLNDGMKTAMTALDMQTARCFMELADQWERQKVSAGTPRVPSDPTEAFVERIVGLQLAQTLAKAHVPEGVTENWTTKANELYSASSVAAEDYLTWTQREAPAEGTEDTKEPEVSNVVKAAVKLSLGKAAKVGGSGKSTSTKGGGTRVPFEGTRRNISKHIANAFADVESGTFLDIGDIQKKKSAEYGDDLPSAGAISIRLFPKPGHKMTIEGVTPAFSTDGKGNKGATKN